MNNRGKTITIFLVLISVLLLSLTVIAMFFFQKESELRKLAELNLEQSKATEAKLQAEIKEVKKEKFILEEKLKESEAKISDLQSDLELAEGVRDQIKEENASLKEALESESQAKEDLRTELSAKLEEAQEKVTVLKSALDSEKQQKTDLEEKLKTLEDMKSQQPSVPSESAAPPVEPTPKIFNDLDLSPQPQTIPVEPALPPAEPTIPPAEDESPQNDSSSDGPRAGIGDEIPLGTIVVNQDQDREGKILSIDKENDFIIFDLGREDGIEMGTVMSIYRGSDYLGDVKVSKVQPDMAAADFIPPFSSQKVRKNDQIVVKK